MEYTICPLGELAKLRLEPKNLYDENAVAVWRARGAQQGYVGAKRALLIGKRMGKDE